MESTPHDRLIQINGELYFADGNYSSFDLQTVNAPNIDLVGYSDSLKEFFVRFTGNSGKSYIYKEVPRLIFDEITSSECQSIGSYMAQKVKGYFRYEQIDWGLNKASLTEVCKHYKTMQYNLDTSIGCWATDCSLLVQSQIGNENFEKWFWQLEYTEIPENCTRIK